MGMSGGDACGVWGIKPDGVSFCYTTGLTHSQSIEGITVAAATSGSAPLRFFPPSTVSPLTAPCAVARVAAWACRWRSV
jgi:hypothetical protein